MIRDLFAMDHPLKWTIFYFFIYLIQKDANVLCQIAIPLEGKECSSSAAANLITQMSKELSPSAKNQLISTLIKMAANSGALPDLSAIVPQNPAVDNCVAASQTVPQTLNIVPLVPNPPSKCRQDPVPLASSPPNPSGPLPNSIIEPSYMPCTGQIQPINIPELPQNYLQQYVQVTPIDCINPCQSIPIALPGQSIQDFLNSISMSQNIITDPTPSNAQTVTPTPLAPTPQTVNSTPNFVEIIAANLGSQMNPFLLSCDGENELALPLNLEINFPAPNVQEPRITIVSTERPPIPYPIVKKNSLSLKKMLPILLLAMLCNDRNDDYCSCNCNSSPNYVPIPYPIPMPINSPIICNHNRYDDDNDDDSSSQNERRRREDVEE